MMFSIITPCYNSEKTIERTLQSVQSQTYQNYEYIIIDGGSVDGTLSIVEAYKSKFNGKMRVISEKDDGIYDAMNKGIRMAQGKLLGIVNSDDFYENTCLENALKKYNSNLPYQIIYGMMRIVNEKGEELAISFNHHRNIRSTIINHPACFVTKALYEKYGCYNTKYRSAADFDFMLKMFEQKEVVFVPDHQIYTNFTYGGMSGSYTGVQEDNEVRYRNGIITRKKYILTKMKNSLKHYLGV